MHMVCHDCANPLAIIKGVAKIHLKTQSNPKPFQRIHRASLVMERLLNRVRQLEALDQGKLNLPLQPVKLSEIFDDAQFLFTDRLTEKNIALTIQLDSKDLSVMADPESLSNEVINNLLSNAIKFSKSGDTIGIKALETIENQVEITIKDQGIGMPASMVDELFNRTARISRKGTGNESGTGFGMPLIKTFVDYYGGSIDVHSQEASLEQREHGTRFTIKLKKA